MAGGSSDTSHSSRNFLDTCKRVKPERLKESKTATRSFLVGSQSYTSSSLFRFFYSLKFQGKGCFNKKWGACGVMDFGNGHKDATRVNYTWIAPADRIRGNAPEWCKSPRLDPWNWTNHDHWLFGIIVGRRRWRLAAQCSSCDGPSKV